MILIVFHFIYTEDRVNYQLRTVTLDHGAGLEGGDGCEVGGAGVEDAASKHGDPAALALVHRIGQPRHDALNLLQHLRLLDADRGSLMSSETQLSHSQQLNIHYQASTQNVVVSLECTKYE